MGTIIILSIIKFNCLVIGTGTGSFLLSFKSTLQNVYVLLGYLAMLIEKLLLNTLLEHEFLLCSLLILFNFKLFVN